MLDDLINEFCTYLLIDKNYSKNTIDSYRNDLAMFDKYINKNINSISDSDIKDYLKYMKDNKHNERSIARNTSTLRSFYKFLVISKYVKTNPMDNITSIKLSKKLPDILTIDETVTKETCALYRPTGSQSQPDRGIRLHRRAGPGDRRHASARADRSGTRKTAGGI